MSGSGYYDVDSILCEEERIPAVFATDAVNLGFLDPSSCEEDLKQDTKIELPLWLAKSLDAKNMVHLELPKYYGTKFLLHLSADPSVVNIREKSPYFFALGHALASTMNDEELRKSLRVAFSGERFRRILDQSLNSRNEDTTAVVERLTNMERTLFHKGYDAAEAFHDWKTRKAHKIRASALVKRSLKRKHEQEDE